MKWPKIKYIKWKNKLPKIMIKIYRVNYKKMPNKNIFLEGVWLREIKFGNYFIIKDRVEEKKGNIKKRISPYEWPSPMYF
jgi:hypothetical protein